MSTTVRLAGVLVAVVVALVAAAAAMVPLILKQHRIDEPPQVFTGSTQLFAAPLSGGVAKPVLRLRGQWEFPVADGRSLLIERPALTRTALWRVPLDGSAPTRVGDVPTFSPLAWSPDRREYATTGPDGITVTTLKGNRVRTLARPLGSAEPTWNGGYIADEVELRPATGYEDVLRVWRSNGTLAWSRKVPAPLAAPAVAPDGRSAAVIDVHRLELVSPSGTRTLATDVLQGWPPVWSPDGRTLLYWDEQERLVARNVATGRAHVVTQGEFGAFAISPDGKAVYLTRLNEAVSMPK